MRRAKLYYLRGRVGKRARVAERRWGIEDDLVIAEASEPEAVDAEGVTQEEAEVVPSDAGGARSRSEARPRRPPRLLPATKPSAGDGARRAEAEESEAKPRIPRNPA